MHEDCHYTASIIMISGWVIIK